MRLPAVDPFSFWFGFVVALALALLYIRFRQPLGEWWRTINHRLRGVREVLTAGAEQRLREDVLRFSQTSHLAGALFALDEILIPPRLLALSAPFDPTAPPPDLDASTVIPLLPEWPDLAAALQAPSLDAAAALSGGSGLLVLGPPGSGKTTLLAHLASRVAQGDVSLLGGEHTPIFVQAADLALPLAPNADVIEPLISAAQARASTLSAARLPRHLRVRVREQRCAIFLDGLDELPPAVVAEVAAWLAHFVRAHPRHRLVMAAGLAGFGPLLQLPLAPALIAPWSTALYRTLISKWAAAWEKAVRSRRRRGQSDTDPQLIMGWLGNGNQGRSVFEVSLKTWAAFAGDARGKRPLDWLEAYVARHGVSPVGQRALARLAAVLLEREVTIGLSRAESLALLAPVLAKSDMEPDEFLDDAVARRLLARHRERLTFHHPLIAAYCVSTWLAVEPEAAVVGQSAAWERALYFLAPVGELAPAAARRLSEPPDLLHSGLFACARWLRDAPSQARWRSDVFRRLTRLLAGAENAFGLRARALAAFVAAADPGVAALFKQHLAAGDDGLRRLSVLGLGALNEVSVIPQTAALFADASVEVRWAAALALGVMTHASSIEELAKGLLRGDDHVRRACAEGLARQPEEGHPVLQEALTHQDLNVRRAAVYGLYATGTDWARAMLEDLQHREQEYFVRSAIQDVLGLWRDPSSRAPRPFAPPDQQGWLIAWAAERGSGVPPGRGALETLHRSLLEGDAATRRAAAAALGRLGDPAGARDLYPLLHETDLPLRETAFESLAFISAAAAQPVASPV